MPTFKHAGKLGDVLYALPAIRACGGGKIVLLKDKPGHDVFPAEVMLSLLLQQHYVESASIVDYRNSPQPDPQTDYSFTAFSSHPKVFRQHLVQTFYEAIGLPAEFGDPMPWLHAKPHHLADIAVSMTDHSLDGDSASAYAKIPIARSLFLGTPEERKRFSARYGSIAYFHSHDLLAAAEVIAGCKVFIGNPSALLAIAVGLGKPCIVWDGMLKNAVPFEWQRFPPAILQHV